MLQDGSFDDYGVINDTGPFTTAPPDASGGGGSFLPGLLDTLTNGIKAIASARINDAVARSLGGGVAAVNADGSVTYRAAPGSTPDAATDLPSAQFFRQYGLWLALGAAALVTVVVLARK